MHRIYSASGAKPANLPLNFMVDWRDGFWVATNFTDTDQNARLAFGTKPAKMLVGTQSIPPGGVAIWQ